jgi:ATP-dependent Clp protease ATP-binding subunit ClpA
VIVAKTEATEGQPAEDKLAFEFLDGPVTPKPEKIPPVRPKAKRRPPNNGPRRPKPPGGPRGDGGGSPPSRGSVPKIPLERV